MGPMKLFLTLLIGELMSADGKSRLSYVSGLASMACFSFCLSHINTSTFSTSSSPHPPVHRHHYYYHHHHHHHHYQQVVVVIIIIIIKKIT